MRIRTLLTSTALVATTLSAVTATGAAAADCTTDRLAGDSRVETAVAISADARDEATTVLLARADAYPDALAAVPLAADLDAPLLLTANDRLSAATATEIERLGATDAIILGGEGAIAARVAQDLQDLDVEVERIGGASRFATAALVAERLPDRTGRTVIVEGRNASATRGWPDAVVAGPLAAGRGDAVLMVDADAVPDETTQALVDLDIDTITIVGGPVSVNPDVLATLEDPDGDGTPDRAIERVSGLTRYTTSTEVAWEQVRDVGAPTTLWLATGRSFPDALAAGAAAAASGGSLLLVDGTRGLSEEPARDFRRDFRGDLDRVVVAGGESAIGSATFRDVRDQLCSGQIPARDLGDDTIGCRDGGLANHARTVPSPQLRAAHDALVDDPSRENALDVMRAAGPLTNHMVTQPELREDVEGWLDQIGNRGIAGAYHESQHFWQSAGSNGAFRFIGSCLALSGDLQGLIGFDLQLGPRPNVIGQDVRDRIDELFDEGSFEHRALNRSVDVYLTCGTNPCASSHERVRALLGEAHAYVSGYEYDQALIRSGAVDDPATSSSGQSLDGGYAVLPGLAMYLGELRRNHPQTYDEMIRLNATAIAELWRILELNYPGARGGDDGRLWDLFFGAGNAREIALATDHRAGVDLPPRPSED